MHKDITLSEKDDRVVSLTVKTNHNQIYNIDLEFCSHEFGLGCDDVQVNVTKKMISEEGKSCQAILTPNRILHREKVIDEKRDGYIIPNVWFEFHQIPDGQGLPAKIPAVTSQSFPYTIIMPNMMIVPNREDSIYMFSINFFNEAGDFEDTDDNIVCINLFTNQNKIRKLKNDLIYNLSTPFNPLWDKERKAAGESVILQHLSTGVYGGAIVLSPETSKCYLNIDLIWTKNGKDNWEQRTGITCIR